MSVALIKRSVRVLSERVLSAAGLLDRAEQNMIGKLTILTFHRVLPDELAAKYPFQSLAVPRSVFGGVLVDLQTRYDLVTVSEGLSRVRTGACSRPLVCLSFDDGYADNVRIAAPMLEQHGIAGTFYVVAGMVGTDGEFWYDIAARRYASVSNERLRASLINALGTVAQGLPPRPNLRDWMRWLKSVNPEDRQRAIDTLPEPGRSFERGELDRVMTAEELRRLVANGHEVGSHTMSHPLLPQLDDVSLQYELVRSRGVLEACLGAEVQGFCYPNGDHDDRVIAAVRNAGYQHACTTLHGRNEPSADAWRLQRVDMNPSRFSDTRGGFASSSMRATISMLRPRG